MTYHYCTLFDSLYLSRALAMYDSLKKTTDDFHLYIFPFDEKSRGILEIINLPHVTIISLAEFESKELLAVKPIRSKGEYCWTCTPAIISFCINQFNIDHCTYIDADLYFFSNPNNLIDEMGENSVLITEHRYSKRYDRSANSGIYCVQFITFKNNHDGLAALNWWNDRCIEWCYARTEDGKFGDQKYLDDWAVRFKGIHVLQNLGGGVAPWNVQQYEIAMTDNKVEIKSGLKIIPLIFYHFHYVKSYANECVDLGNFQLSKPVMELIYKPYLLHLIAVEALLLKQFQFERQAQNYFYKYESLKPLHRLARKILGIYNVFSLSDFKNGSPH